MATYRQPHYLNIGLFLSSALLANFRVIVVFFVLFCTFVQSAHALAIQASQTQGTAPLTVSFNAITNNINGLPQFTWSTSDGQAYSSLIGRAEFTFNDPGTYIVSLQVLGSGVARTTIIVNDLVSNLSPVARINLQNGAPVIDTSGNTAATTSDTGGGASANTGTDTSGSNSSNSNASSNYMAPAPFIALLDASQSSDADGQINQYRWYSSDGRSSAGIQSSFVYTQAGVYTIRLEVEDNLGAIGSSQQDIIVTPGQVIANQAPIAAFSASTNSGQAPLLVQLDASQSTSSGSISSYQWLLNGQQVATGAKTAISLLDAGAHILELVVIDSLGNEGRIQQSIMVSAGPSLANLPPQANFEMSPNTGQTPLVVTLDASSSSDADGTIKQYEWRVDNERLYSGQKVVISLLEVGVHEIVLTITDNHGLQSTNTQEVLVLADSSSPAIDPNTNQVPIALFTASASGGGSGNNITLPLTMNFDASKSEDLDGYISQYAWTVSPVPSSNFPSPLLGRETAIAFPNEGVYTVTLTVTDDKGASSVNHQQISVLVSSSAQAASDQSSNQTSQQQLRFARTTIDKSNIARGKVDFSQDTLAMAIQVDSQQEHYFIHAQANSEGLDPSIRLYRYPQMQIIDKNANWFLHDSANEMYQSGLAPKENSDAAMIISLNKGWYIAEVIPEKQSKQGSTSDLATSGSALLTIKKITRH